jgi:hypothetical protein
LPEGDHSPLKRIADQHDPLQAQVISFREDAPADPDSAQCSRCHTDSCVGDCFTLRGAVYRVGDNLPDGRRVLAVDGGIPTLGRRS